MGKGKPRWGTRKGKKLIRTFGIFCRMVGPGGTSVTFYRQGDSDKIEAVWTHENCPYSKDFDERYAAADGHNVSVISAEDLKKSLGL